MPENGNMDRCTSYIKISDIIKISEEQKDFPTLPRIV